MNTIIKLKLFSLVCLLLLAGCGSDDPKPSKTPQLVIADWTNRQVVSTTLTENPSVDVLLNNITDKPGQITGMTYDQSTQTLFMIDRPNGRVLQIKPYEKINLVELYTELSLTTGGGITYTDNLLILSGLDIFHKTSKDGSMQLANAFESNSGFTAYCLGMDYDKGSNTLYIADFQDGIVKRSFDEGSDWVDVYPKGSQAGLVDEVVKIVIHPETGKMYWTDEGTNLIMEGNMSGEGDATVLYDGTDGVNSPQALAIDFETGTIYWSEVGANGNRIRKGSLDGNSEPELLFENIVSFAMALIK